MLQIGRIHSTQHIYFQSSFTIYLKHVVTRYTSVEEDGDGIEERSEEAEKGYRNYRECYNVHLQRILIELTQEMLCHLSRDGCYEMCCLDLCDVTETSTRFFK